MIDTEKKIVILDYIFLSYVLVIYGESKIGKFNGLHYRISNYNYMLVGNNIYSAFPIYQKNKPSAKIGASDEEKI